MWMGEGGVGLGDWCTCVCWLEITWSEHMTLCSSAPGYASFQHSGQFLSFVELQRTEEQPPAPKVGLTLVPLTQTHELWTSFPMCGGHYLQGLYVQTLKRIVFALDFIEFAWKEHFVSSVDLTPHNRASFSIHVIRIAAASRNINSSSPVPQRRFPRTTHCKQNRKGFN